MVTVSLKPLRCENYNAVCSASESNKQNTRDRTLDLLLFFHYEYINFLKTSFRLQKARVCPTGFRATFQVEFVLIY